MASNSEAEPTPASVATDAAEDTHPFETLCAKVKGLVPEAVGTETWYLIIAAVLIASPNPSSLGAFYTYLTTQARDTRYSAPSNQPLLLLRLRDVLLKLVTLVGAPPVVVAVGALAAAEGRGKREVVEREAEASTLSEKWKDYDMSNIEQRGQKTINSIYGPLLPKIFAGFGCHKEDIVHMEVAHVYGLYLSDHSVLNAIESEVVVLTAILCTGLRNPGLWHVRGLGRLLGARGPDAENEIKYVIRGVKMAAIAAEWPNVGDVSRELDGFGDDPFEEEAKKEAQRRAVGEGAGEESETGDTKYHHEGGEEEREWAKEIRPSGSSHMGSNEAQRS